MKRNIFIPILSFIILMTSCDDFLMKIPHTKLSDKNFYRNADEINAAVTGCYNALLAVKNSKEHTLNEVRSDNAVFPNTDNINVTSLAFYPSVLITEPTNDYVELYWASSYHLISRVNRVISNLNVVASENQKWQYEAETRFLRAWAYFNLVRYYGDVPLITEVVNNGKEAREIARTPVSIVYDAIMMDLTIADSLFTKLGANYKKEYGRVNKWAVKTLLGKVYLTLSRNDDAKPFIEDVYKNSGYKLTQNYGDLFVESLETTKGAEEIIFPIRFTSGGLGTGNYFSTDCANLYQNTFGNAFVYFSNSLRDAYVNTSSTISDKRYKINCSEVTTGHVVSGFNYPVRYLAKMVGLESDGAGGYKSVKLTIKNDGGLDFPELRFAEVALIYAELFGEEVGLPVLNNIRNRAGAPVLTAADIDTKFGGDFREAVLNEARLELAGENKRFFDLLRMGNQYAVNILTDLLNTEDAYSSLYYIQAYNLAQEVLRNGKVDEWRLLLPIPFNDIMRSDVLEQNPGYIR